MSKTNKSNEELQATEDAKSPVAKAVQASEGDGQKAADEATKAAVKETEVLKDEKIPTAAAIEGAAKAKTTAARAEELEVKQQAQMARDITEAPGEIDLDKPSKSVNTVKPATATPSKPAQAKTFEVKFVKAHSMNIAREQHNFVKDDTAVVEKHIANSLSARGIAVII